MKRWLLVGACAAGMGTAAADAGFAPKGSVLVSADRLIPVFGYSSTSESNGNNSTTTKTAGFSLLWSGIPADLYNIPRLGVDYAVAPNVTIGGEAILTLPFSASTETKAGGMSTSADDNKTTIFGLGVRAGYVLLIGTSLWFWPRGMLSYTHTSTSQPSTMAGSSSSSSSQFALQLEPMLVYMPGSHFGVTVGPVVDIPLSGSQHRETIVGGATVSTDNDASEFHIGITAGLIGWL